MAHSFNKIKLLILLSLIALICNINCLPLQSKSYNTPSTTVIISTPTIDVLIDKRDDEEERERIKEAFDIAKEKKEVAKALAEAAKERAKEEKDRIQEQHNDQSKSTIYSKHQDADDDNKDNNRKDDNDDNNKKDKDDDKKNDSDKPTATNTVVTTVVVVSTESPTVIYSDTNSNPSKQKGDTSANHQVNDPNSTASSPASSSSSIPSRGAQARSNYRKLVLALSIVGSVAGIAIFAGLFVLTRVKLRKRQEKANDIESGNDSNNSNTPSPPSRHITPPPNARLFPLPNNNNNNNDATLVENPFSDPIEVLPSAPPPAVLYPEYRQNRTFSMLSQTTATAIPSAPTAKELDAQSCYENPFEEEYGTSTSQPQRHHHLPPPPAYTPNAIPTVIPSAPPLYALPHTEDDVSRRYSTSSCSDIQVSRPPSVRRGSGTITHVINHIP